VNVPATGAAAHRRHEILRLVRSGRVRSQEQLQELLLGRGFRVTQPTLSRDLRELAVAKTAAGYVPGETPSSNGDAPGKRSEERLDHILTEFVLSVDRAGTLVVVKTPPAAAHAVAHAIDQVGLAGVVGTIAGDDTIFLATQGAAAAGSVARRLLAPIHPSSRRSSRRRA